MAEEEKSKQLVQMSTVVASGITAIVAALFTSRLGVAGTLIGTALTPMLMTIGVAILNAQIQKATTKISELPSTVRGNLSTQRVRVPGTPTPDERPEEPEPPATSRRRDRRSPGVFERLISIPTYLKEMSPSTRRWALVSGVLAGLVAAVIGLAGVTGIEVASGSTVSCTVWGDCPRNIASGEETGGSSSSLGRALAGGSSDTELQNVPTGNEQAPVEDQQQDAQPVPNEQQTPQNQQYQGSPQTGDQQQGEETPAQPSGEQVPPQSEEQPVVEDPAAEPQNDGSQVPPEAPGVGEGEPAVPPVQQ